MSEMQLQLRPAPNSPELAEQVNFYRRNLSLDPILPSLKVNWKECCCMVRCITSRMEMSRFSRLGNVDILTEDNRSEHSIRFVVFFYESHRHLFNIYQDLWQHQPTPKRIWEMFMSHSSGSLLA